MNIEPEAAGSGHVFVSDHVFVLCDAGAPIEGWAATNGLVAIRHGVAVILTGISHGPVNVQVEAYGGPPAPDAGAWEDVVEVSLEAPAGRVIASGIATDPPTGVPTLTRYGPGTYRLRIHVRGRDLRVDHTPSEAVEDYLIQAWPAPHQPEVILKQTDQYGAEVRSRTWPTVVPRTETEHDRRRAMMEANLRRMTEQGGRKG
jgi:hypothetical protein